jgi:hypothetical protein
MVPSFDIDVKGIEMEAITNNVDKFNTNILKKMNLPETTKVSVVNRSNAKKISYHIRIPGYCVKRIELKLIAMDLIKED